MSFLEDEIVIINEHAKNGIPSRVGENGIIINRDYYRNSPNYEYAVQFDDGMMSPVREVELNKLTEEQKQLVTYIKKDNKVTYTPTGETVTILKCDFLHGKIEVEFEDAGIMVVGIELLQQIEEETWRVVEQPEEHKLGKFTEIAFEIGKFTDKKNKQYGSSVDATYKMVEVLMERYTYDEENYLMPKSLLQHLLLQVRMMDKQNRIFNNPSGEGDSESPYNDLAGYSLIGIDMIAK